MQKFLPHQKLIYNPELRFRKEEHRCIAYTIDDFFYSPDKVSVLLPQEVITLLLFDGEHTFLEVAKNVSYVFGLSREEVESLPLDKLETMLYNSLELIEKRTNIVPLVVDAETVKPHLLKETQNRYPNPGYFVISKENIIFNPRDLRLSSPLSVNYNVMTSCGFKCKYCYHPLVNVKDLISLDRLKTIFTELKESGCESFMLTGGDPMLRADIDEMMKALHDVGLYYSLSTKSVLTDERIKKLRNEAGLTGMQISLDSSNSETVKYLLGINDDEYLTKLLHMIDTMQQNNIDVRVKAVLTSYNVQGLSEYLNMLYDKGIRRMQVVQYGRSGTRHTDDLFPTEDQLKKASDIVENFKQLHTDVQLTAGGFAPSYDEPVIADPITNENIFAKRAICNAGRFSMTMMPNGEVFVCEQLPYDKRYVLGDLRTMSVNECWNGELMTAWLSPPSRDSFSENSPCRSCKDEHFTECHKVYSRCLRFIYEHTGDTSTCDIKCPHYKFEARRIT